MDTPCVPTPTVPPAARPSPDLRFSANEELVRRYQAGDQQAAEELLRVNAALITQIAGRILPLAENGLEFQDLFVEGQMGLLTAAAKFDPKRGVRFTTYAVAWIRQRCARAADESAGLIRVPAHRRQEGRKEGIPAIEQPLSLDWHCGPDKENSLVDLLPDDGSEFVERVIARETVLQLMDRAGLTDLERRILIHRFGLFGHKPQTLDESGRDAGRSREGARHAEDRAVKKLKAAAGVESRPKRSRCSVS